MLILKIVKYYIINQQVLFMRGKFHQGKLCTKVTLKDTSILVKRSPKNLIAETLHFYGYELKDAIMEARASIGNIVRCPFIVNPYQDICMIPEKLLHYNETIWINPQHIVKTRGLGRTTKVLFSNGQSILLDTRLVSFNYKRYASEQLSSIKYEKETAPLTYYCEKKHGQLKIVKTFGNYLERDRK